MAHLFMILNDGGILISYPILILMIVILFLFIRGLKVNNCNKTISLISSLGWFVVAWGFLGRTIGLIKAFDTIQAQGHLTPSIISEGLKMALVGPLVGIIVFIIARIAILILTLKQK
jgi:biopolymer transport protein ExbB/TolQ